MRVKSIFHNAVKPMNFFAVTWSRVQNSKQGVPQSAPNLRLET